MPEIGATLREARMRARIDVSEIEAQTKIRAKYLRALENEEWDLVPGPTVVKSFLRTYAQALGLDGKTLVEEYRLHRESPNSLERSEFAQQPLLTSKTRSHRRRPPPAPTRGYTIAMGVVGVVIVLLVIGLLTSGNGGSSKRKSQGTVNPIVSPKASKRSTRASTVSSGRRRASLTLLTSGEVYVCLIGDEGRKVIPGVILKPGVRSGPYHARRFALTLGNNAVRMYVNGTPLAVAPSSQAIGYTITATGRHTLPAGRAPTCA